ncbi:MAG: branched-chain amino acid ABC transporter permease [Acidimicrobiia bacterium]|nr:branched-chain amino acid ABC transporter permease [Acidimicrobiia bacterium]MDH5420590.1 branched-chain amino acid ABC transporter permease [Acidimicrobiia bacterium]MDH5504462.1 branched-chain amino acid ABC transporter permease [Acidimicrobiia bacterium]
MTTSSTTESRYRLFLERFPVRKFVLILLAIVIAYGAAAGSIATLQLGRFSSDVWINLFISGVARGSVYAIIALGYTLVYGILFIINFAHGEVFMAGAFTAYFVAIGLDQAGMLVSSPIISIALLFLVSSVVSMIVAILLERIAYRPLRGAPRLVPLITAIGASLFLQYTFRGFYGANARAYPTIPAIQGTWDILGYDFQKVHVISILGAVALWLMLYWIVERTRVGRAMRAVGEDREIAALMGVDVDRTIVFTFAVGGALAGAAGILYVFLFNQAHFFMGFFPGLKAFTAAVLGGIGSITGAALGGLILGILETVGPNLFLDGAGVPSPNQLIPIVAFGILVLVLIFLPGGFLGAPDDKSRA